MDSSTTLAPNSIWGRVYVKDGQLGIGSIHFDKKGPYMSYINETKKKLDNGNPLPKTIKFENVVIIDECKTFTGRIKWGKNTFKDITTEEYMCVMSDDWNSI